MRIIRKFVLAGLLLGLNAMAFAQDHQHHDGCTGNHDSATEQHVCANDAKAMKPQANMAPQTMAFQNDIYAAINTVDNTIEIGRASCRERV